MATFLLIRHGRHSLLDKRYVARTPGVSLSDEGRAQAEDISLRLTGATIEAIYSSPMERAVETAEPLAKRLGLDIQIREELNEIDIGDWTNMTMEEIDGQPGWKRWNEFRSCTRPPNGELILEAQVRMVSLIEELRSKHAGPVALFSHGDPIRGALAHYLGIHIDLFQRIEVEPASVSVVEVNDWGPCVLRLNDTGPLSLL